MILIEFRRGLGAIHENLEQRRRAFLRRTHRARADLDQKGKTLFGHDLDGVIALQRRNRLIRARKRDLEM